MRKIFRLLSVAMLVLIAGARLYAYTVPYESWMGTYVGEKKMGYMSYKIDKAEHDGIQGYRIASILNNRMIVLGADLTQIVTSVVYTDSKFAPLEEDFAMSSGGKTTKVRATFKNDVVECAISAGSGSSQKNVPIPKGASLVGDAMFAVASPEIGKEYNMNYFNPLTLSIDDLKIKVEGKEKVTLNGKDYDTVMLKNSTPMGDMTVWQDAGGEIVKVKAIMGITMVMQTKDEALAGLGEGTQEDFAVLTSIRPDKKIESPRELKKLCAVIDGIDEKDLLISDDRQQAKVTDAKLKAAQFNISASNFDPKDAAPLPFDDPKLSQYLTATSYIDSDVSAVKDQGGIIVGEEKNSYKACSKIRSWIFDNLHTRADIGITRSASDVLKSKVGVCRDYAILFAALARSQGIPSKVVSGLVYTNQAFYYHAWVECYVGKWVPFDATMNTDFVDATHIKMAEGDATSMFGLARVIGSMKVNIKEP